MEIKLSEEDGIYSYSKKRFRKDLNPILAVHPFFPGCEDTPNYIARIKTIIKDYEGPLISFVGNNVLHETIQIYKDAGRKNASFFVETYPVGPELTDSSWDNVFALLQSFRHPLHLVGGCLGKEMGRGCLKYTSRKLKSGNFSVEIREEVTFDF